MEEKIYKIEKIDKDGVKTPECKLDAYDIEEAIHRLVRLKEGKRVEVLRDGTESKEIIIRYAEAYEAPEKYLVSFSHLLKDQSIFKTEKHDKNENKELEVIHARYLKQTVLDKEGNEILVTYGLEFFNEYETTYSLGMSKEELLAINENNIFEEVKEFVKDPKLKAMIEKYKGLFFNDVWVEQS